MPSRRAKGSSLRTLSAASSPVMWMGMTPVCRNAASGCLLSIRQTPRCLSRLPTGPETLGPGLAAHGVVGHDDPPVALVTKPDVEEPVRRRWIADVDVGRSPSKVRRHQLRTHRPPEREGGDVLHELLPGCPAGATTKDLVDH